VPAAVVDKAGTLSRRGVELGPGGRATLGQLQLAVAAAEQPFARTQPRRHPAESPLELGDVAAADQVGAKAGERVIDDMRVGIVEPGQDRAPGKLDELRGRTPELQHLSPADAEHPAAAHGEVAHAP